jgi:hypothetical protein
MSDSPTVAIVDPLSTGAYLASEFAKRNWNSVAVLSTPEIPAAYVKGFRAGDFRQVIRHVGNTDEVVAALDDSVSPVVAGRNNGGTRDQLGDRPGLRVTVRR